MATRKVFEILGSGVEISIEYNDVNKRIGNINYTIPAGHAAHAMIWNNGVLVFDDTCSAGVHSEVVPGNYRVTEHIDPQDGSTYATMPPEISWNIAMSKI